MESRDPASDVTQSAPKERERLLVKRFQRRLGYVFDNLRFCRSVTAGRRTFNQSIDDLKRAQRPRSPPVKRTRLHPEIEFLISWKLMEAGIQKPKPQDVKRICKELSASLKPRRGRPRDDILQHHVEALSVLSEETCGKPLLHGRTLNSGYNPMLKCQFGKLILTEIQSADPNVTETAVVNILRAMPSPESPERKRFKQYFPFADTVGELPDELPGFDLKPVGVLWPIYCS